MTDETKGDGMTLEQVRDEIIDYSWDKDVSIERMCKTWIAAIESHLAAQSAMRVDEAMVERAWSAWREIIAERGGRHYVNDKDLMRYTLQAAIGRKD